MNYRDAVELRLLTEDDNLRTPHLPSTKQGEYQDPTGETRTVTLYQPFRSEQGSGSKFSVYVENPDTGNVNKIGFGDPDMEIRRDNKDNLRNFRSRHSCDSYTDSDKHKPGFWSCVFWRSDLTVTDILN